ncbi:MAG: DUF885 domain-containing protein [Verrucomicrobia bacterium]|nr:DUF885 domain-containing protein [Verrucomicrobiota bacterium]
MKIWVPLFFAVLAGCVSTPTPKSADTSFQQLTDAYLASHFAQRPLEAVALGWHQYDGKFAIWDRAALEAERENLKRFDAALAALPSAQLSSPNRWDVRLLRASIAHDRWAIETQRAYAQNPMTYAGGLDVLIYFTRDFAPLHQRIRQAAAVLRHAPAWFAAARTNLDAVLPRPFVETAIEVAEGGVSFLEKEALAEARRANDAAALAEFEAAQRVAVSEFKAFAAWLKSEKLPKASDRFALGRAAFAQMLRNDLIDQTPEEILEIGLRELRAEQARFVAAARVIDPDKPAIEVFKAIQREHPTAQGLIPDTRKNLEAIRQFVVDHRIVTLPSEVRARVEETPPPQRATSFASMDTPGPFETKATEAYYYVTPTEPQWPAAQKEEWLTAFNYYALDVTSIHEAYPGHYVQFLALNASAATRVKKIFATYAFVEGWAHYTEQMLVDEGFGQCAPDAPREAQVRAAKYRLEQSDEALLRLCRLCCAVKLHCQGASVDDATRFFRENCYYEEKPARSEATRGTFDPGYFAYTLGKLQILKLRRDWQAQEGAAFSLQRLHDELLRHGAPPLRMLREVMLQDRALWKKTL